MDEGQVPLCAQVTLKRQKNMQNTCLADGQVLGEGTLQQLGALALTRNVCQQVSQHMWEQNSRFWLLLVSFQRSAVIVESRGQLPCNTRPCMHHMGQMPCLPRRSTISLRCFASEARSSNMYAGSDGVFLLILPTPKAEASLTDGESDGCVTTQEL